MHRQWLCRRREYSVVISFEHHRWTVWPRQHWKASCQWHPNPNDTRTEYSATIFWGYRMNRLLDASKSKSSVSAANRAI